MRIETRQLIGERKIKLWEAVPLSSPWTVYLDVSNKCNFKCLYCPTGNPGMLKAANRTQQHMPMELFKKIVKDMAGFDKKVLITNCYKDGDPLVNRNFVDMVHILRDADVTEKIYSKTNGELIPRFPDLADAPLDMLGISVPHVHDAGFIQVVGKKVSYEKYREGIKRLFEDSRRRFTINAKMAKYRMTDEHIEKFYEDFEPITDTCAIEGLHGWGANDMGDMLVGEEPIPHDGSPVIPRLVCPLPFYMMSISSDGITNVCCAEWGNFHNLGNAYTDNLVDLWNNQARRDFQIMHLTGNRFDNRACASCQYRDTLPDRIDEYRFEMLDKFKKDARRMSE